MLDSQMGQAMAADPTGEMESKMPAFMKKIDQIEAVVLPSSSSEIKEKVTAQLADIKEEDGYESLLKVKQQQADINIISKKGKEKSDIFICVISGDTTIVLVKMTGDLNEDDFKEIIKEQQKNMD